MVAGTWTTSASANGVISAAVTAGSFVEFTGTVSIPAGTTEIGLRIRTSNFSGTGSGNDYMKVTDVFFDQLDACPIEAERILCGQRCRLIAGGLMGRAESTTKTDGGIVVAPLMAAAPTISVVGTIRCRNTTTGLYTTATTPSVSGVPGISGGYIELSAASWSPAFTAGDITTLACDAAKSGILLSAEL